VKSFGTSVNSLNAILSNIMPVSVSLTLNSFFYASVYSSGVSNNALNVYDIGINRLLYSSICKICLSNPIKSFGTSINSLNVILPNIMPSSVELTFSIVFYLPVYSSGVSNNVLNVYDIGISLLFYSSICKICLSNPVKSVGIPIIFWIYISSNTMPSSVSLTLNIFFYESV